MNNALKHVLCQCNAPKHVFCQCMLYILSMQDKPVGMATLALVDLVLLFMSCYFMVYELFIFTVAKDMPWHNIILKKVLKKAFHFCILTKVVYMIFFNSKFQSVSHHHVPFCLVFACKRNALNKSHNP